MNIIETILDFSPLKERTSTNRIILHNSGVTVLQSVEIIHNYHKNTKGWAGIGYHFYVRKDGSIYRGRPENTVGAHAYNNNSDSIGICFEGDFNQEVLSDVQKNAGKELISYLCKKYGITKIQGHKEVNNTSCPGSNFPLDEMKEIKKNEEPQTTKSIADLANEVIAGKYGVGEERKKALGSLYSEVQAKVNEIILGKKTTSTKKSNEEIANEVIAGKWDNGAKRKELLKEAGYDYNAVQKIVNAKMK